jgi:curli biogenesis system outer membrane secretion channel CsgG
MKQIFTHISLLMLICACSTYDINEHHASIADSDHEIKRVAVVDFDFSMSLEGKTDRGKIVRPMNAGSIVADIFTQHLLGTGLYRVVERKQIGRALNELNIDTAGLFDASSLDKLQKTLNVDGLIVGVVMEYGNWRSAINWGGVAIFTARLVDIETGLVIWATSANLSVAMTNSGAVAHVASQEALRELSAKLGK